MAKSSPRKLKVFQTRFGFYDTVVAAPSQPAALRAWGIHQNLFATGLAKITEDPQAVQAARAHPGIPLKRAVGSSDPYELEPARLPTIPEGPKKSARKAAAHSPPSAAPAMPPPDRSLLDAAEADLRRLAERHERQDDELRRRQDELDAERAAAQASYVEDRTAAMAAIVAARQGYRKAGGQN